MCRVAKDLEPVLAEVDGKGKPVCLLSDGLNLVDNCGGIYGYLDMLRTINGGGQRRSGQHEEMGQRTWLDRPKEQAREYAMTTALVGDFREVILDTCHRE